MTTLALTGVVTTTAIGTPMAPGLVSLTLPTPVLAMSAPDTVPDVIIQLPTPQLKINALLGNYGGVQLALPVPALAVTGKVPVFAYSTLYAPVPSLAVTGKTGLSGSVALALPTPTVAAHSPNSAGLNLPVPQLAATALTGLTGGVSLALPVPGIVSTAKVPYIANVSLALPTPTFAVQATLGNAGATALTLRQLALAVTGETGTIGTVALKLPIYEFTAAGYMPAIGVVQLTLPSVRLSVVASAARGPASTVVMHTETNAVWTYSNFPFNSFARFNGVYLGAGDNGVFALVGDTDNGTPIQAAARVGISDFSTSYLKRVDRIYVGYSATGDLVLRVFTDAGEQRDYRLTRTPDGGLHGNHARLGKGLQSRYWQFEVRNMNGADFTMNMIELKPTRLKRRVGGRDA